MAYRSHLKKPELDRLFEAILLLESQEECYRFFEDICTVSELEALGQRLEVAQMLHRRCTYQDIAEKTGASSATISRVNRSLQYGAGGYKLMMPRLPETVEKSPKKKK
ncbi:MAG: YerC/YecD family TrpR-related protein [Christensenellales bacterium]|jgi:TrpR-related protein YerC/YecD